MTYSGAVLQIGTSGDNGLPFGGDDEIRRFSRLGVVVLDQGILELWSETSVMVGMDASLQ